MPRPRKTNWVFIIGMALSMPWTATCAPAQELLHGSSIFGAIEGAMLQIKTVAQDESSKQSYGSGYVVAAGGMVITNYHVVAEAIQQPRHYRIVAQYQNQSLPAAIAAVDVVHDLALLRIDHPFPTAVRFAKEMPAQGEEIFALGLPEDLNFSLVKGTYNGILRRGPYEVIHLSAPINSGMSGGPTVNAKGEVIGTNVSRYVHAQNISFSVPQQFARSLLDAPPVASALHRQIEEQLRLAQDVLTQDLLQRNPVLRADSHWQTPAVPDYFSCWHEQFVKGQKRIDWFAEKCTLQDRAYISNREYFGNYELEVIFLRNRGLPRRRFYTAHYSACGHITGENENRSEYNRLYTNYHCAEDRIANSRGNSFQISVCAHQSLTYPSIYDAQVSYTTLSGAPEEIVVKGTFSGFTMENIKRIVHHMLEATAPENAHAAD